MKRMSQMEVDARKALGMYNNNAVDLQWLIVNVVKALADERRTVDAYRHTVNHRDETLKELFAQYEKMDTGDDPKETGVLMVNNKEHARLGLVFKRALGQL